METERVERERAYHVEYEARLSDYITRAISFASTQTNEGDIGGTAAGGPSEEINEYDDLDDDESHVIREELNNIQTTNTNIYENCSDLSLDAGKHLFLTRSRLYNDISPGYLNYYSNNLCKVVRLNKHKSDFVIIILIRLLYLVNDNVTRVNHIISCFEDFSFWPTSNHRSGKMPNLIFWSENHTFMYLSTAYLLYQKLQHLPSELRKLCLTEKESTFLRIYLNSHCHENFNGVYEVLSTTYLPYTLASLLNLYDFAEDPIIREQAHHLINRIVCQFTLVANRDGICNLTASARQYPHTRLRNQGHNINQLIYLVTGVSNDAFRPTPLVDFLLTSSWRPPLEAIENFMLPDHYIPHSLLTPENETKTVVGNRKGYFRFKEKMNHRTKDIREIYQTNLLKKNGSSHLTPFFWSAGLITHPNFIEETLTYQKKHKLFSHPGLVNLNPLQTLGVGRSVMSHLSHYSKGQSYTGINLNTFKSPTRKVIMTSFDQYNVSHQAYQQISWMVNLNGIGIWSQSGDIGYNAYTPAITQSYNITLVVYCMHHTLRTDNTIDLFWPKQYFNNQECYSQDNTQLLDETTRTYEPSWWFGERDNCYVGVYCNKPTTLETSSRSDAKSQYICGQTQSIIPRRHTTHQKVYWIIVVGDDQMYDNFRSFQSYCWRIVHSSRISSKEFIVTVTPPQDSFSTEPNPPLQLSVPEANASVTHTKI